MKKICVVTAARSEYGLLRWLMHEIKADKDFILQVIVTGSHLSPEFGLTFQEIENDGFIIDEKIEMLLSSQSKSGLAKSMGVCTLGIADAFERLKPDLTVVLGDRYELLPVCSTALVMNIPIAHISGGDITEGAIDDQIRNAITQMSDIHFPGNEFSANRIIQMGGKTENVFNFGEPGIENFLRLKLMNRKELADNLGLDISKKWVLATYHPETKISLEENLQSVENIIEVLNNIADIQIVFTYANADFGGNEINGILEKFSIKQSHKYKVFRNLGRIRYLSFMKNIYFTIGNSSSGIVESPVIPVPAINIGNRQTGRFFAKNIVNSNSDFKSISDAVGKILLNYDDLITNVNQFYGDGNFSKKCVSVLKMKLQSGNLQK